MVLKSGKGGVRSGNTLRGSNSRYNKQYLAESCIVRKSTNLSRRQSKHVDVADDAILDSDGVVYSLNKKGRWALPGIIKDNIKGTDIDDGVTVCMYQKHKVKRQANCVEYSCNKGRCKSIAAGRGYFNEASVNVKNEKKEGKKSRRRKGSQANQTSPGDGDEGKVPDPDPEIRYDVFYPSPATSSLTHNPKYIRNIPVVVYDDGEVREAGKSNKKGGRRRANVPNQEAESEVEDSDSFEDQESENECAPTDDFTELQSPEVMLIDILEAAERAKVLCTEVKKRRVKAKRSRSEPVEDEWVLLQNNTDEDEAYLTSGEEEISTSVSGISSVKLPRPPHLEAVRVILPCDTILPHRLQENFQERYMEAQCHPRRFIINVTQDVEDALRKSKQANLVFLGALNCSSCLVFTRDAQYDDGLDVYRVQFNIFSTIKIICLETLFDLMTTTVEEVVYAAANFATTLPVHTFQKKDLPMTASSDQKHLCFQFVCLSKSMCASYQGNKDDFEKDFEAVDFSDVEGAEASGGPEMLPEKPRPEYCDICFTEINPEFLESESATCMDTCGHWFCDGCWREHVTESIYLGKLQPKCPEYNCDVIIDNPTLLSLINIKLMEQLQNQRFNNEVETNPNKKWCPNHLCGRVLEKAAGDQEAITVTCVCGKAVCFSCLKDAHWPATCEQTTSYTQRLKKSGDDQFVEETDISCTVRGKYCPKCKRHIEKNGGCKYMYCICGHEFCWVCLVPWDAHKSFYECSRKSDFYGDRKVEVRHIPTPVSDKKSSMFKHAVTHRNSRKPMNMRSLKTAVNSLSTQLRNLMHKGVNVGADRINSKNSSKPTPDDVHSFLMQMLQLKLELNHVIEHTAVLLDGRLIRTRSLKIVHILERLNSICLSLEADLGTTKRPTMTRVLPNLLYLRSLAQRAITALVSCVAQAHSTAHH